MLGGAGDAFSNLLSMAGVDQSSIVPLSDEGYEDAAFEQYLRESEEYVYE